MPTKSSKKKLTCLFSISYGFIRSNFRINEPGLPEKEGIDERYVKEALAAVFYYNGKLSEKEACTVTKTTRRQFEEIVLPKFGLSVMGGTQRDVEFEVEAEV